MKNSLLIVFASALAIMCTSPTEKYNTIDANTLFVDLSDYYKVDKPITLFDLVDIEEYTALKDSDIFYVTEAGKIEEWKDLYILLEKNKQVLVAFDKEGNFISTVGSKGEGPGQYSGVTDFVVDPKRNLIVIYSRGDLALYEFDMNLEFVRQVKLGFFAFHMSVLSSGNIAFYLDMNGERDGKGNIWICDTNGNVIEKRMVYPTGKQYLSFDFTGFLKNGYYTYPLSSKIYRLNENHQPDELVWSIEIPRGMEESEIFEHQKYFQANFTMQKMILNHFEVGRGGHELIFNYNYISGGNRVLGVGFQNKSGQVFNHKNLKETQHGDWFSRTFFSPGTIPSFSQTNNYFYSVSNLDGLYRYLKNGGDFGGIKSTLVKVLRKTDPERNPIIIKFKLKDKYNPHE